MLSILHCDENPMRTRIYIYILQWFHNETNPASKNYDMIFQDDGARTLFYAPYSANTGFYYVRNNERTQSFFNSLLMAGDLIFATYSHQIALIAVLSEHVSLYGLKVKVWNRNLEEFPGGYTFHERPDLMKKLVKGEIHPYIFHMSWTENKADKIRYMEQMGEWYLQDTCKRKSKTEILHAVATAALVEGNGNDGGGNNGNSIKNNDNPVDLNYCCAAEPLVKCHYRDKPSIIPCPDAPPIDEDGKSFW